MSNDINRIFMIGRLTKDPDLRYTHGGTSVASFSVANNRSYITQNEKKEQVSYFGCVAWGKTGEVIAQHCKKGQRIGIEGRLQQRSWQDQSGQKRSVVEIVVESFNFIDGKKDGQPAPQEEHGLGVEVDPADVPAHADFSDESIPF